MPATSKAQQKAAGAALAAKRGEEPKSKLRGASKQMEKSMSEDQLEEFASTKRRACLIRKAETAGGSYRVNPDDRYFVVRGQLWRMSDPSLDPADRDRLVKALMAARRAVSIARRADDADAEADAHAAVDRAKHARGERGPVWWNDGAPDLNRHMARTTPYADWFANLPNNDAEPS